MSNYIYLIQEREFIKTNENIYKIGKSTQENNTRIKQYPKGSKLLFQMICENCHNIEKILIKKFKDNFKLRKDIGNEYFEGDIKNMIDIIFYIITNNNTVSLDIVSSETAKIIEDEIIEDEIIEDERYEITTYEEWIKYNNIDRLIITNKIKSEGYIRFKGQLWRQFYDKNSDDFDEDYMEDLLGFIEWNQPDMMKMVSPNNKLVTIIEYFNIIGSYKNNITDEIIIWDEYRKLNETDQKNYDYLSKKPEYKFIHVDYNINKIHQDIIKKCYLKKYETYELKYNEYLLSTNDNTCNKVILNTEIFTFTSVDNIIHNKVITENHNCFPIYSKNIINYKIVDDILNSLISSLIKYDYKNLVYNLLVKQKDKVIIFYDYNEYLLTEWIRDLLSHITSQQLYCYSTTYYDDKTEFKKIKKSKKYRLIIIKEIQGKSIKTQINDFIKLGFKNIIVLQNNKNEKMYNIVKYRNYLRDNKEYIINCLKEENYHSKEINMIYTHNDEIFSSNCFLLTNFLKWCCSN